MELSGPFERTVDSVGSHTFMSGPTNIALDSVGAADIASILSGPLILISILSGPLILISILSGPSQLLSILSGPWAHHSCFCRGHSRSLLVRSGRSILTTQFYRGHYNHDRFCRGMLCRLPFVSGPHPTIDIVGATCVCSVHDQRYVKIDLCTTCVRALDFGAFAYLSCASQPS